jgi:hypothetical protein
MNRAGNAVCADFMSGRMIKMRSKRSGDPALARGAVLVWLALLVFAVGNGFFRQRVLEPQLGKEIAHVLSTMILCGAVFVGAVFFVGIRNRPAALRRLWLVGLGWATATALTEVVVGLSAGRRSPRDLFADYDLTRGRLFALVLLAEITAAPLVGGLRNWAERRDREPKNPVTSSRASTSRTRRR